MGRGMRNRTASCSPQHRCCIVYCDDCGYDIYWESGDGRGVLMDRRYGPKKDLCKECDSDMRNKIEARPGFQLKMLHRRLYDSLRKNINDDDLYDLDFENLCNCDWTFQINDIWYAFALIPLDYAPQAIVLKPGIGHPQINFFKLIEPISSEWRGSDFKFNKTTWTFYVGGKPSLLAFVLETEDMKYHHDRENEERDFLRFDPSYEISIEERYEDEAELVYKEEGF